MKPSVAIFGIVLFVSGFLLGRVMDGSGPRDLKITLPSQAKLPPLPAIPHKNLNSNQDTNYISLAEVVQFYKQRPRGTPPEVLSMPFLRRLSPMEFPAAIQLFSPYGNSYLPSSSLIYQLWAELDVESAMNHAEETNDYGQRARNVTAVAKVWAQHDSKTALEWATKLPNGLLKNEVAKNISRYTSEKYPLETYKWLISVDPQIRLFSYGLFSGWMSAPETTSSNINEKLKLVEPRDQQALVGAFLEVWARNDPKAAGAWLKSEGNAFLSSGICRMLAAQWTSSDPKSAWEFGLSLPPTFDRDGGRLEALTWPLGGLVRLDAEGTIKLVENLPVGPEKQRLRERLVFELGASAPDRVAEYIDSLPEKEISKNFGETWITGYVRNSFHDAVRIANQINNPAIRETLFQRIHKMIQSFSPAHAADVLLLKEDRTYIDRSSLLKS